MDRELSEDAHNNSSSSADEQPNKKYCTERSVCSTHYQENEIMDALYINYSDKKADNRDTPIDVSEIPKFCNDTESDDDIADDPPQTRSIFDCYLPAAHYKGKLYKFNKCLTMNHGRFMLCQSNVATVMQIYIDSLSKIHRESQDSADILAFWDVLHDQNSLLGFAPQIKNILKQLIHHVEEEGPIYRRYLYPEHNMFADVENMHVLETYVSNFPGTRKLYEMYLMQVCRKVRLPLQIRHIMSSLSISDVRFIRKELIKNPHRIMLVADMVDLCIDDIVRDKPADDVRWEFPEQCTFYIFIEYGEKYFGEPHYPDPDYFDMSKFFRCVSMANKVIALNFACERMVCPTFQQNTNWVTFLDYTRRRGQNWFWAEDEKQCYDPLRKTRFFQALKSYLFSEIGAHLLQLAQQGHWAAMWEIMGYEKIFLCDSARDALWTRILRDPSFPASAFFEQGLFPLHEPTYESSLSTLFSQKLDASHIHILRQMIARDMQKLDSNLFGLYETPSGLTITQHILCDLSSSPHFDTYIDMLMDGSALVENYVLKNLNFSELSTNGGAIRFLERNVSRIMWDDFHLNPRAMPILAQNEKRINWSLVIENDAGHELLSFNPEHGKLFAAALRCCHDSHMIFVHLSRVISMVEHSFFDITPTEASSVFLNHTFGVSTIVRGPAPLGSIYLERMRGNGNTVFPNTLFVPELNYPVLLRWLDQTDAKYVATDFEVIKLLKYAKDRVAYFSYGSSFNVILRKSTTPAPIEDDFLLLSNFIEKDDGNSQNFYDFDFINHFRNMDQYSVKPGYIWICCGSDVDWGFLEQNMDIVSALFEKFDYENCPMVNVLSCKKDTLFLLEAFPHLISWEKMSQNPHAIDILFANKDKIDWKQLCKNPAREAVELLRANVDKICWTNLCQNRSPYAIALVEQHKELITLDDVHHLLGNEFAGHLFYSVNKKEISSRNKIKAHELIAYILHPDRIKSLALQCNVSFEEKLGEIDRNLSLCD